MQELIHGKLMYPDDKGDRSHQLLDVVAALKCQYPDRVHLILGNHELSELTGRIIGKDGKTLNVLFRQGIKTAYGAAAEEIYEAYKGLFAALPLAVRTPNRVFVCHTLPDEDDLDRLDLELLKADTWPPEAMPRHGTIYALTWGRDTDPEVADRFAAMVDADWFITGHQPCDEGFRQANHRADHHRRHRSLSGLLPVPHHHAHDHRGADEVRPHHRRHGAVACSARTAPPLPSSARQKRRSGGKTSERKPC